jgi:hypothetical protein
MSIQTVLPVLRGAVAEGEPEPFVCVAGADEGSTEGSRRVVVIFSIRFRSEMRVS